MAMIEAVETEAVIPEPEALAALAARYQAAVRAVAEALARELDALGYTGDEAWEHAVEAVEAWRWPATSPHAWIFTSRLTLALSTNVALALEPNPGGEVWDHADLATAIPVVAEHDVLSLLAELREMDPEEPGP